MIEIREAMTSDWPAVWAIVEPVFRAGETYAVAADITEDEARAMWMDAPQATFVAVGDIGDVLGTYYIKPNQSGPGDHVCNCGYIVGDNARGKGIATLMCEHSQDEARRRGFRAMQYNLVVATNQAAIALWQKLGFRVVGTVPAAFRHPRHGDVDAHVMHKTLIRTPPADREASDR